VRGGRAAQASMAQEMPRSSCWPAQALVDDAALADVGLEIHQLLVGPAGSWDRRPCRRDSTAVRSGAVSSRWLRADGVDNMDAAPTSRRSGVMPSPARVICSPMTRRAERLREHLGIGGVVTQVGDDERIVVCGGGRPPRARSPAHCRTGPCGSSSSSVMPRSRGRIATTLGVGAGTVQRIKAPAPATTISKLDRSCRGCLLGALVD